jgi:uncharacterized membrane protein
MSFSFRVIKGEPLLTIGYANFSHVTVVFIAKYLFTGSVKILNKILFKIAIKLISGCLIEINFIAILNNILFNIFTLPVKRYLAMNTTVT